MGNIRPTYVKRVAIDLVQRYNDRFTDDFEKNKDVVDELTDVKTSTFRNQIAGYVTTYRKNWEAATVEADEEETPSTAELAASEDADSDEGESAGAPADETESDGSSDAEASETAAA